MLGPGRYLLGVLEIAALVGFAWLGASSARVRLLPRFAGAPARLATGVLALALAIIVAELLGTVSLLEPLPYLVAVGLAGAGVWVLGRGGAARVSATGASGGRRLQAAQDRSRAAAPSSRAAAQPGPGDGRLDWSTAIALMIAAAALLHFAAGARLRLSTGMTGFDSTWYHGPFAAGFFQSGDTIDLHFIAPQFLAWFYPANGEIFHAAGMLAFGRDVLSPLLNVAWFAGCLLAAWCIGRPYRVGSWSLVLAAIALSVPALSDQAGEARNDIVGIFFLLAAAAVALNAWATREEGESGLSLGALGVVGLAAGLAAGTKLNFLLPAAVLALGLVAVAPRGRRARAFAATALAGLAGGGYWYLRNLVHSGSPLPWVHHLGPISLPAPEQALGGREAHSVLAYLSDGAVWSDWFLPGLHHGLWILWPLLALGALTGLLLCLVPGDSPQRGSLVTNDEPKEPRRPSSTESVEARPAGLWGRWSSDPILPLVGLVGLATALAWLVAPTSASGPDGIPRGFESGLRYLAPALVLGLALLPTAPAIRGWLASAAAARRHFSPHSGEKCLQHGRSMSRRAWIGVALGALAIVALVGYPVQRHYLQSRYANPSFSTPGLNAAFKWAQTVSGARIATTSTRQYPLFGTDLSNRVEFIGSERPHGGFAAPTACPAWRRQLNAGHYDYVVTTRDRLEPGKPPYPPTTRWTESPRATPILRIPPTVVFRLSGRLDPSSCPS